MKTAKEIKEELIEKFGTLKVGEKLISESPHFADYVRMGHWLSAGVRGSVLGAPVFKNALTTLDADMIVKSTKFDGFSFKPADREAVNWSGTDVDKLMKLENTFSRGQWTNTGVNAVSDAAGRGSVVMYGPYTLPQV
jgi:hypothetical protein